jgi:hypothetical protein
MKGLLLRLSSLDADAENAVRVISFFDELITNKVTLHHLVQATARLAECPAGAADSMLGVHVRVAPDGHVEGDPEPESLVRDISLHSRVWLERPGPPLPLDDIVLERFAIAAAMVLDHPRGPLPELGDAALMELALSESAGEAERARAVRLMRFDPTTRLHVLAVAGGIEPVRKALGNIRVASLGRVHAVLTESPPVLDGVEGVRVGVSPAVAAIAAPDGWRQARTALRFAALDSAYPAIVRAVQLGALAVLAERVRVSDIADVHDVATLDALATEPNGADTLAILDALCATGSARKAAAEVYRHHSTVTAKLAHAESKMGFSFATPAGRLRLELAILFRHLRNTAD